MRKLIYKIIQWFSRDTKLGTPGENFAEQIFVYYVPDMGTFLGAYEDDDPVGMLIAVYRFQHGQKIKKVTDPGDGVNR